MGLPFHSHIGPLSTGKRKTIIFLIHLIVMHVVDDLKAVWVVAYYANFGFKSRFVWQEGKHCYCPLFAQCRMSHLSHTVWPCVHVNYGTFYGASSWKWTRFGPWRSSSRKEVTAGFPIILYICEADHAKPQKGQRVQRTSLNFQTRKLVPCSASATVGDGKWCFVIVTAGPATSSRFLHQQYQHVISQIPQGLFGLLGWAFFSQLKLFTTTTSQMLVFRGRKKLKVLF